MKLITSEQYNAINIISILFMRCNFYLLLLLCYITGSTHAQTDGQASFNIGDPAPPLRLRAWLKGEPVQRFEKGKCYVLEFWATWCIPCKAAMPRLSVLANSYKNDVVFLGIDVMENKNTSLKKIKTLVDSMGTRMDYAVAVQDSDFMERDWLHGLSEMEKGIPKTFVIDAEGKIAWIGHPSKLEEVLPQIVSRTWDIKEALAKRNLNNHLAQLDRDANETLALSVFTGDRFKTSDHGNPDSALSVIDEIVSKEPGLKYAPFIALHTFSSLLKTNPHKAYAYGKEAMVTSTYEDPAYSMITIAIENISSEIDLPPEIFHLGAEAYQIEIDQFPYPELLNTTKRYKKMAEWYSCAGDESKANEARQKAIGSTAKNKKAF